MATFVLGVILTSLTFALPVPAELFDSTDWSYNGPTGPGNWSMVFPVCGGAEQSPIDLGTCVMSNFESLSGDLLDVKADSFSMTFENNGHTVLASLPNSIAIRGSGLPQTYYAQSLHFHWGKSSERGSEHTIEGKRYPLELHLLTYKSSFKSFDEALHSKDRDALAVLGVLTEVDNGNLDTTAVVDSIVDAIKNISESGEDVTILVPTTSLASAFRQVLLSPFYRYSGSLTTPGCDEKVVWTIFQDTLKISEEQLEGFRTLFAHGGEPLVDNFRPLQNASDRTVYCSVGGHANALEPNHLLLPLLALLTYRFT